MSTTHRRITESYRLHTRLCPKHRDSFQEDDEIGPEIPGMNIPKFHLDSILRAVSHQPVPTQQLKRPSYSGTNLEPIPILRHILNEPIGSIRRFRPRPDKTHITNEYIPQLRQLIKMSRSEKSSDSGNPVVIRTSNIPLITPYVHCPELVHREKFSVQPDALLTKNDRSGRSKSHEKADEYHRNKEHRKQTNSDAHIKDSFPHRNLRS